MAIQILVAILLTLVLYWYLSYPKKLPPGPLNLPFIGYAGQVHWNQMHKKFWDLGKKYGPLSCFYRFKQLVVVINDYDLIKKAMLEHGDAFTGKFDNSYALRILHFKEGLVFTDGEKWREQRRFSLSALRDLGFGRPILEQNILDEIQYLIPVLRSYAISGNPVNPKDAFEGSISNVIFRLIFGKRCEYDDPKFSKLVNLVVEWATSAQLGAFIGFQSWLRLLPILRGVWQDTVQRMSNIHGLLGSFILEHEDSVSSDSHDYVDHFRKGQMEGKGHYFSDSQLLYAIRDLFGAGLDTTSTTMLWTVLLMAVYPEVQHKCQEELETVCENSEPTFKDRIRTKYIEATILEIQRWSNVLPFLSRRTVKEVQLGPYVIPEETCVCVNTYSIHLDENIFEKPKEFNPDRFISANGTLNDRTEYLFPFGLGKRACLGESLARMEVYLIFTSLLRQFNFRLPKGAPKPRMDCVSAMTLRPYPYEVVLERRSFDLQ